jgi:type IV secretory pathway VirB10-like protein
MSDPNSIIPPDPEGLFPTRKISRPAVLITAGAALGLVFLVLLMTVGEEKAEGPEAELNSQSTPEKVEAGTIPEILRDLDGEVERFDDNNLAAQEASEDGSSLATADGKEAGGEPNANRSETVNEHSTEGRPADKQSTRGKVTAEKKSNGQRSNSGPSNGRPPSGNSSGESAAGEQKRAEALLELLRKRREASSTNAPSQAQPSAFASSAQRASSPAPGTRDYYRQQLERRARERALSRGAGGHSQNGSFGRGGQGPGQSDPVEKAFMAGATASPVVSSEGAASGIGSQGTFGGSPDPQVQRLRQMQQMAEDRGDGELAQMIAWMAADAESASSSSAGTAPPVRSAAGSVGGGSSPQSRTNSTLTGTLPSETRPGGRQQVARIRAPLTPFEIKEGTTIPAQLETAVNTDVPGGVRARITRDVYDSRTQQHLLIPKGSVALGSVEGGAVVGQRRIAMVWDRLLLPDGRSIELGSQETKDGIGAGGVRGRVDKHAFRRFSGALMVSLVGAGARIATAEPQAGFVVAPNAKTIIGQGAAQQTAEVATSMLERNVNIRPTIKLEEGHPFHIYLQNDVAFAQPYRPSDGFMGWEGGSGLGEGTPLP